MLACKGVAAIKTNQRVIGIPYNTIKNTTLALPEGLVYTMGIDQSSTCVGICIQDWDRQMTIQLDCNNDKTQPDDVFYREVKNLLRRSLEGVKLKYVVSEQVPSSNTKYTRRVLVELHGRLNEWRDEIPELGAAYYDTILPQTWKKMIPNGNPCGLKERNSSKYLMTNDILRWEPLLTAYRDNYTSHVGYKDYDSFDGYGLNYGYRNLAYTPDGQRMIFANEEKKHNTIVGYKVFKRSELNTNPKCLIQPFGETAKLYKVSIQVFNPLYDLHKNLRMASTVCRGKVIEGVYNRDKCTLTFVPEKYNRLLSWKLQHEVDAKEEVVAAYVLNKSTAASASEKIFKAIFDYEEVVTSD